MDIDLEELLSEAYRLDGDLLISLGVVRAMRLKLEKVEQELLKQLEESCLPE